MSGAGRRHTLELRAQSLRMIGVTGSARDGETERLTLGPGAGHADIVDGVDRVRVAETAREHTGHNRVQVAKRRSTEVMGDLTITSAYEDTVLVAGTMTERFDNGAVIAAAMSDDLVVGVGVRVTTPLDIALHGILGAEERAGSALADGVVLDACGTLYEREFGPGVHNAGVALFSGTNVITMRSGLRPLMRTALGVRNLVPAAGGGGGGDAPPAPPPGGPPAGSPGMLAGSARSAGSAGELAEVDTAGDLARALQQGQAAGEGDAPARRASSADDIDALGRIGDEGGDASDIASTFSGQHPEPYVDPVSLRGGGTYSDPGSLMDPAPYMDPVSMREPSPYEDPVILLGPSKADSVERWRPRPYIDPLSPNFRLPDADPAPWRIGLVDDSAQSTSDGSGHYETGSIINDLLDGTAHYETDPLQRLGDAGHYEMSPLGGLRGPAGGPSAEELGDPNLVIMIADGSGLVKMDPDVYDGIKQGVLNLAVFDAHGGHRLGPDEFTVMVPGYVETPDGELRWLGGHEADVLRIEERPDTPQGRIPDALGSEHDIGDAEKMGRPRDENDPPDLVRIIAGPNGRVEMDADIFDGVRQGVLDYAVYDARSGRRLEPDEYTLAIPGYLPNAEGDLVRTGNAEGPFDRLLNAPPAAGGGPPPGRLDDAADYGLLHPDAGYEALAGRIHVYRTLEPDGAYSGIDEIGIVDPNASPLPKPPESPPALPEGHPPPRPKRDNAQFKANYAAMHKRYMHYRGSLEWRGLMAFTDARNMIDDEVKDAFIRLGASELDLGRDGDTVPGQRHALEVLLDRESDAGHTQRADEIAQELARIDTLLESTLADLNARADEFATVGPPGTQRAPIDPNINADAVREWIDTRLEDAKARMDALQNRLGDDVDSTEMFEEIQRASWERDYYSQMRLALDAGVNPLAESSEQLVYITASKGADNEHVRMFADMHDGLMDMLSDPKYHNPDPKPTLGGFDITKLFPEAALRDEGANALGGGDEGVAAITPLAAEEVQFVEAPPVESQPFRNEFASVWRAEEAKARRRAQGAVEFVDSEGMRWVFDPTRHGFVPGEEADEAGVLGRTTYSAEEPPAWRPPARQEEGTQPRVTWESGVTEGGEGEGARVQPDPPDGGEDVRSGDEGQGPEARFDESGEEQGETGGTHDPGETPEDAEPPRAQAPGTGAPEPRHPAPWREDGFAVERALHEKRLPEDFAGTEIANEWQAMAIELQPRAGERDEAKQLLWEKVNNARRHLVNGEDPRPQLLADIDELRADPQAGRLHNEIEALEAMYGQVDEAIRDQYGYRASQSWLESARRLIAAEDGANAEEARRTGIEEWERLLEEDPLGWGTPEGPPAGSGTPAPAGERTSALYASGASDAPLRPFEGAPPGGAGAGQGDGEIARPLGVRDPQTAQADATLGPPRRDAQAWLNNQMDDGAGGRTTGEQVDVRPGAGEGEGGSATGDTAARTGGEIEGGDPAEAWKSAGENASGCASAGWR